MSMFEKPFVQTLKDLADKLFGGAKLTSIHPRDPLWLCSLWPELAYPHVKATPRSTAGGTRYGQQQRAHKTACKGHRMKKRRRTEGPYAP